ncbi:MAG: 4-hydroxy-tetrahydrodipicolinate reductase [Clostridia bacterium]|nr:4-hydroxy-tetrahydrodipicolinate reductase [Clostridia bacterium]
MINIILSGSNGKMGQVITHLIEKDETLKVVAGVSIDGQALNDYPVYKSIEECTEKADVVLDFSNAVCLDSVLSYGEKTNTPLVIATTGFNDEQSKKIEEAAHKIPVFRSANMSIGVNLLLSLVKQASKVLADDFDIEITDIHHNTKVDAPSGTALMIADAINEVVDEKENYCFERHSRHEKRPKNEIGIHSIRGGNMVGEHTVMFLGQDEVLEITHKSFSREIFAAGALKAVKYIVDKKPGKLYSMSDMM